MYSNRVINARLDQFAAREGWMPVEHSLDQVQQFIKYIDDITSGTGNSKTTYYELNRTLTTRRAGEIRRWVENEQVLCALDSSYWESRYAYICCPPESPVWMADYTFKPIGEIKPGDDIIGFEKRPIKKAPRATFNSRGRRRTTELDHVVKTKVIAVRRTQKPIIKVTMKSGETIRCTPDHLWSSGENDRGLHPWIQAKVGKRLRKVVDIYPNEPPDLRTAAWLGGMYDGEGSGVTISQYKEHNPEVHARLIAAMQIFGFKQKFQSGKRHKGSEYVGHDEKCVRINGELTGKAKFISWCRPIRAASLEKHILRSLRAFRDKVVKIEADGEGEVIALETGTGNYVAWGYYSRNCDEGGNIYKFKNRMSQEVFDSVISDFDDRQVSIELLILKARQLGVTTKTALKFMHRLLFIPHTQAVMASVQAEKSELIGRILDTAYNRCPWWLVPRRLPKKSFSNGSILSIQSGSQGTGIAQGWTPQCIHISELCDIPNPKKVIDEGLLKATHSTKNLFLVFESTGGGNTGWLADTWRASKAKYPKDSRLCPIFIPWPMATDLYPEADWVRKFPIPGGFMSHRLPETIKHVQRCESYIRNTPYLAIVAGKDWTMPIEQQWFWQFNYKEHLERHAQKIWLSQMPADDFEALTGKHDPVFDPETISELENNVYEVIGDQKERKRDIQAYAVTGMSIDDGFEPKDDDIDWDKPVIPVHWKSNRGQEYDWELVPLKAVNENVEFDTFDKLLVYEVPKQGYDYACGIDTADGLGKPDEERFCASMSRTRFGDDYDYQVAEITSNRINSAQAVAFIAAMSAWYGSYAKDWRGVKFAIEQIKGPGDTCQNQLKLMGFHHHHKPRRYDSKKVKDDSTKKEGWYSNAWSVPILTTRFIEAINGGWYRPYSKYLIEEIRDWERHQATSGRSKMEHQKGKFDDRIRAAAMSYFTTHDLDDLAARSQKRYSMPQERNPPLYRGPCALSTVGVGGWE